MPCRTEDPYDGLPLSQEEGVLVGHLRAAMFAAMKLRAQTRTAPS